MSALESALAGIGALTVVLAIIVLIAYADAKVGECLRLRRSERDRLEREIERLKRKLEEEGV